MPRFFVEEQCLQGKFAVLTGEAAAHARVLRLKNGDRVTLCSGTGVDRLCTVSDVSPGQISLCVEQEVPSASEPKLQCSVYLAYAKADKVEHVVQKATELGAAEIVTFPSARCVSRPDDRSLAKKLERWQRIAAGAAEQSGRGRIPRVRAEASFADACAHGAQTELPILLYENEAHFSLRQAAEARSFASAALITGPEGGFAPEEVDLARSLGVQICTLGPRILRCETAPLCALTAILFAAHELD